MNKHKTARTITICCAVVTAATILYLFSNSDYTKRIIKDESPAVSRRLLPLTNQSSILHTQKNTPLPYLP